MKKHPLPRISLPIAALVFSLFFIQCTQGAKKTNTQSAPNLIDENNRVNASSDSSKLAGTWELNYITGSRIAFGGLYPNKKPTITFDVVNNSVSGNTSCNNFSGQLKVTGNKIDFTGPIAMTKMMCQDGKGENVFVETLKKVNTYTISNGTSLNFIQDDMVVMRFSKK